MKAQRKALVKLFTLQPRLEDLVRKLERGDRTAQKKVYEMLAPKLLGVCRRYVKRLEEAEEVLSNTFVKIFTRIEDYNQSGPFEAWARKIAVNESLNFIRYQKNLFVEVDDEFRIEPSAKSVDTEHEVDALMEMIDQLPLGYRTVFNLYAIEGYQHNEISDMLGITESTSRTQLRKARLYLQEQLESRNYLP
ncbi:MAG: RNA polymerase sigma factor [Bacteroidota bacterium]|nr:RNA polymerase sigma factor [Bacteroidota bacterium]